VAGDNTIGPAGVAVVLVGAALVADAVAKALPALAADLGQAVLMLTIVLAARHLVGPALFDAQVLGLRAWVTSTLTRIPGDIGGL
jgi:hypothetical protein